VRATGYDLARPSISEWVDIWRIEGLLAQKLYRNGCIGRSLNCFFPRPITTGNIVFVSFSFRFRFVFGSLKLPLYYEWALQIMFRARYAPQLSRRFQALDGGMFGDFGRF
jgi:hypothetical protein